MMGRTTRPLLEARQVVKRFGGLAAVDGVDLAVWPGDVVGLIGPNGSGKTTLFDCLSRITPLTAGRVWLKGIDVTGKKPYQVARMGLARTFQVIRVYGELTVINNLELSIQWGNTSPLSLLRPSPAAMKQRAEALATFFHLGQVRYEKANNLSGGQRRLLEIAMALMPDPDILLLDEATSGVNPIVIGQIKDRIRELNESEGKTFLLIEHDIRFIADLCDRVVVLDYGAKLAEGTPADIMDDEAVIDAYFGSSGGVNDE
jgi:ABC-type branched-subunit amino acid transport system ATPase component